MASTCVTPSPLGANDNTRGVCPEGIDVRLSCTSRQRRALTRLSPPHHCVSAADTRLRSRIDAPLFARRRCATNSRNPAPICTHVCTKRSRTGENPRLTRGFTGWAILGSNQ